MTESKDLATADPRSLAVAQPKDQRMDLIRRQLCPGASDLELQYFLETSRELGLSPLSREIYAIMRNTRTQVNGRWESVPKMTIQIGIDGFRTIGARTGRFGGMRGPYWCGPDGKWKDVWLSEEPPAAAKVDIVLADTRETVTGITTWKEFSQWMPARDNAPPKLGDMWQKMPAHMLAKTAEAQAWRKALPAQTQQILNAAHVEFAPEPETSLPAVRIHLDPSDNRDSFYAELDRCGWDEDDARREFVCKDLEAEAERRGGWAHMTMALRANVAKHMRDTLLGDGLPEQTESGADLLSANDGDPLKEAAPLTVCEICGEREAAGFWGEKEACQTCIDRELAAEAVAVEAEPSPVRVPFPDTKPASAAAFQMECFNRLGLQPTEISRRLGEGWSKGKKAADLPGLWDTLQAVGTEQLPLGAGE